VKFISDTNLQPEQRSEDRYHTRKFVVSRSCGHEPSYFPCLILCLRRFIVPQNITITKHKYLLYTVFPNRRVQFRQDWGFRTALDQRLAMEPTNPTRQPFCVKLRTAKLRDQLFLHSVSAGTALW